MVFENELSVACIRRESEGSSESDAYRRFHTVHA